MNLDQIEARTRSVLRDPNSQFVTQVDIVRWANDAQLDLAARLHLLDGEASGSTDGTNLLPLPADFLEGRSLRIGTEDYVFVDDEVWWSWSDAGLTPKDPLVRVFGSNLELHPTPATGLTYKLRHWRKPKPLVYGETAAPVTIASGSATAEIATFNTSTAHGLSVGDILDVTGCTPTAYNGTWTVLTVTDTDTFSAHIGSTPGAITVAGTIERTDVPEVAEELHTRIVAFCQWHASHKQHEFDAGDRYHLEYEDGLPPKPTSSSRTRPGPMTVTVEPGPFDLDPDRRHV